MSQVDNCCEPLWQHRGQTVKTWGLDNTGLIDYRLNSQGFRHRSTYDWPAEWAFFGNSIVFGIGVDEPEIMTSYFANSQNYGLAGQYMNFHGVANLKNFLKSSCCTPSTRIVFFWIDREIEDVDSLIQQVKILAPNCLNISSGQRRPNAINLMPHRDRDVSGTHPGPKSHKMWARTIQLLCRA
jgi:hypothetical protein